MQSSISLLGSGLNKIWSQSEAKGFKTLLFHFFLTFISLLIKSDDSVVKIRRYFLWIFGVNFSKVIIGEKIQGRSLYLKVLWIYTKKPSTVVKNFDKIIVNIYKILLFLSLFTLGCEAVFVFVPSACKQVIFFSHIHAIYIIMYALRLICRLQ